MSYCDDCASPCATCEFAETVYFSRKPINTMRNMCTVVERTSNMIHRPVEVYPSTYHGNGLHATSHISRGAAVAKYGGSLVRVKSAEADQAQLGSYAIELAALSTKDEKAYVDARRMTVLPQLQLYDEASHMSLAGGFANSCKSDNGVLVPAPNCQFEEHVIDGKMCIVLVALCEIHTGDEIIVNYHWLMDPR